MSGRFFSMIITGMLLLAACGKEQGTSEEDTNGKIESMGGGQNHSSPWVAIFDPLRLRSSPGERGEVIAELPAGALLFDKGEVSDFMTPIRLKGKAYQEPWLRMTTEDGREGWVYAAGVRLNTQNGKQIRQAAEEKKLQSLFGKNNLERIKIYRDAYLHIKTPQSFASVFKAGKQLRDTLVSLLAQKVNGTSPPDLFWMVEYLPAYLPQLVAEGTEYYLFQDYRKLLSTARQTTDTLDDEFIELCIAVFPEDSIEYFFPSWVIQTGHYSAHSLLGRGIHNEILARIDTLNQKTGIFNQPLKDLKTSIVNDITRPEVTYWESRESIILEMDSIIRAGYDVLTDADNIALETKRQFFEDPEANDIQLNYRSGIY